MNICISCPEGHPVILAAEKLGQMVACPRCFATFFAELDIGPSIGARKDDRKVRRSRDDDDDDDEDEEEEKPKKKPAAMKPGNPPAKKSIKGKSRDEEEDEDEDEEDDDDDDEAGEEEPEIEWTGRKRQLNKCGIGLTIMMVAFYMLVAMIVFLVLPMIWTVFEVGNAIGNSENKLIEPKAGDWFLLGMIIAPMAVLVQTTLIVGLFFNFFVPARVGARGLVLCALIFGGLVYLLGTGVLLSSGLKEDAARAANVNKLLGSAAGACFVISIMSAMAYLAKLMTFMKLHLEASQPITNMGFFFLYFAAMFGIMVANSYVSYYIFWFACFAMIVALFGAGGLAIRAGVAQAMLCLRVRRVIMKFIRDD
jgi:hypothetical protein